MASNHPYSLPKERGKWRSFALAAGIHVLLLLTLYISISFHKEKPLVVEAEIWDPVIKETGSAAPSRPTPPPPKVVDTPPPPPVPAVKTPAPTPPAVETPPQPDPEIALEKERERKRQEKQAAADAAREKVREEKEAKELRDQREAAAQARQQAQQKADAEHQKQIEKQQAQEQVARQKKLDQEKADKAKAEQAAKDKAAKDKADKAAKDKAAALEKHTQDAREAAARERTLQMLQGQANNSASGNGDAARSQGPKGDPDYSQKVGAKIRSNINFAVPPTLSGNPAVEFEVNLLPDGTVASIRKLKPSGVAGFDEAVARAIQNSAPYPKNKDGTVPSSFIGTHKPKDQ